MLEAQIKVRMSTADAHYAGNLVDGAKILEFFGDVATELLIRNDGDEGLLVAYDEVEFIAPVYAGDFIEVRGKLISQGNTSRKMEFRAEKVITADRESKFASAAKILPEKELVCKASGTCVVPLEKQRKGD